jgi:hypothetical protein
MPALLPILRRDEAPRPRGVRPERPPRIEYERPSISFDLTRAARNRRWRRADPDSREIILDQYSAMIDGELSPRCGEVTRGIHGRLEIEADQFGRIVAPGERVFRLSQRYDRAIAEPRTVAFHCWCSGGITRGLGPVDFIPAVFLRPCARDCGKISGELKVDRFP